MDIGYLLTQVHDRTLLLGHVTEVKYEDLDFCVHTFFT